MDFGFGEERGKIPFSYSSSSSSPSSSSQYKTANLISLGNNQSCESHLFDEYQQQPRGFELMARNDEVVRRSGGAGGHGSSASFCVEKEHMFDKVVTPSDVGKLNRLVIPKQQAERYFPLDSSTNEKGLLLNFEDRHGKSWRFRYSYWNSSQSYVMTKGWSRFVKEKKLDAGDIVSFQRGVGEAGKDRLFIDWQRRPDAPQRAASLNPHQFSFHHHHHHHQQSISWSPLLFSSMATATSWSSPQDHLHLSHLNSNVIHRGSSTCYGGTVNPHPHPSPNCSNGSILYFRSAPGRSQGQPLETAAHIPHGGGMEPMVFDSVPVVRGKATAKKLRLFGVNMECPASVSDGSHEAESHLAPSFSSSGSQHSLQLRLYNGTPIPTHLLDEENPTTMSLNFNI